MPSISREFIEDQPERFSPYVFILTTLLHPTSVAMAAVAGGSMKVIELRPGTTAADLPEVQQIIRDQREEDRGQVPLFGAMTGFLFVYSESEGLLLDLDGNVCSREVGGIVEGGRRQGKFWPKSLQIQQRV